MIPCVWEPAVVLASYCGVICVSLSCAECRGDSSLLQQRAEPTAQQADSVHHPAAQLRSVMLNLPLKWMCSSVRV